MHALATRHLIAGFALLTQNDLSATHAFKRAMHAIIRYIRDGLLCLSGVGIGGGRIGGGV